MDTPPAALSAQMNCPACSRIIYQRAISDTGGTYEIAAVADTGSPEYLDKVKDDFYRQARCGRRLRVRAQTFWMRRIDALCGPMSVPSTFSNMAALWNQPIAVANASHCQSCVFVRGRPLLPICVSCALNLATHRRLVLAVVRGREVYAVNHWKRRRKWRNMRLRFGHD